MIIEVIFDELVFLEQAFFLVSTRLTGMAISRTFLSSWTSLRSRSLHAIIFPVACLSTCLVNDLACMSTFLVKDLALGNR